MINQDGLIYSLLFSKLLILNNFFRVISLILLLMVSKIVSKMNLSGKLFSKFITREMFFAWKIRSDIKKTLSIKLKIMPFFWDVRWLKKNLKICLSLWYQSKIKWLLLIMIEISRKFNKLCSTSMVNCVMQTRMKRIERAEKIHFRHWNRHA